MKIDKVEQTNTINYNIKVIHESWVKYTVHFNKCVADFAYRQK